jgi:hypothetical protein
MASATQMEKRPITGTSIDLLQYQNDLVRTQSYVPRGRIHKIAIGPSSQWRPRSEDPFIKKFGRLIDFRGPFLPVAEAPDGSALITAPLWKHEWGVGLPDVPDPAWAPPSYTPEEVTMKVARDPAKDRARSVKQLLEDRCEQDDSGNPVLLENTNFLVFQPVLTITYQPELQGRVLPVIWKIGCMPDRGGMWPVLLVDYKTGEAHLYAGRYEFGIKAIGER